MKSNRSNVLLSGMYTVCFLGLVSVGLLTSIEGVDIATLKIESITQVIDGKAAKKLEDKYDDKFPIKQLGINFWSAIDYQLFSEGKPGVIIGDQDWLFTDEEFIASPLAENSLRKNMAFIQWVDEQLHIQGVKLVVSLVPAKARVMSDKLLARQPASVHQSLYPTMLAFFKLNGMSVADGLSAMREQSSSEPMFFRYDTHWTPDGASLVAAKIAAVVKQTMPSLQLERQEFVTEIAQVSEHKGDLLNFLPLTPWFEQLMPTPEFYQPAHTYMDVTESSLFGDFDQTNELDADAGDVALVGTSYSANHVWNFSGALKQHLATDIVNFSSEGEGPMAPMLRFIQQQPLSNVKLVIWEIPERYMLFDYTKHYAAIERFNKHHFIDEQADHTLALASVKSLNN
jgi:alginate O-acetyltransferase complex protein AlgJ